MVMFLNAPFCREAAALSGLPDEPDCLKPFAKNFWRGVLPRWQPPGRTEHLETPHFFPWLRKHTHSRPTEEGKARREAPGDGCICRFFHNPLHNPEKYDIPILHLFM